MHGTSPREAAASWLEPGLPRLLSHRGLALDAPENTLLAFFKALALGAKYLETDVHASKDGVAIIAHDPDLQRVAGRSDKIRDLTVAELKTIDLGAGQTFCTLAEALEAFPEARFNIDIKSLGAARPAAEAILEAHAIGRCLIGSFSENRRLAAVNLLPGIATSATSYRFALALVAAKLGLKPLIRAAVHGLDAVQVPERAAGLRIATRRVIDRLHSVGVEVHMWTINDVAQMKRLLDLGVDGLITDRIDLAIDLVARESKA